MVAFDATILSLLFLDDPGKPTDPESGKPIDSAKERVDLLVATLDAQGEMVVIPTPALSELLVKAGEAGSEYLSVIDSQPSFRIVGFDQRAAIEVAAIIRQAMSTGDKRSGSGSHWQKVKFDYQIVGIAKVEGCHTIYTDDPDVANFAHQANIRCIATSALPTPIEDRQKKLFDSAEPTEDGN